MTTPPPKSIAALRDAEVTLTSDFFPADVPQEVVAQVDLSQARRYITLRVEPCPPFTCAICAAPSTFGKHTKTEHDGETSNLVLEPRCAAHKDAP